jgi:hypothetical protein
MVMGGLGLLAIQSPSLWRQSPRAARYVLSGIFGGIMLFVLLGLTPGTDVLAHFGGFVSGLVVGGVLSLVPGLRQKPMPNLLSGLLFALLVIWPWWLALEHARQGGSLAGGHVRAAFTEQGGADAHEGRAFFDGDFKIIGHPHAQMRQGSAEDLLALPFQFAELAKNGPRSLRQRRPGWDSHQAVDFQPGEGVQRFEVRPQLVRRVAELTGLADNIHLQQNRDCFRRLFGAPVDFFREAEAIDTLDHVEQSDGVAGLVGLEMADHVPAQPARAQGDLGFGFLHLVFAEEAQPEGGCGADDLWRLTLGHRDEGD